MKRLLATGVTGFIGAHCLRVILEGDYDEVHVVSRSGQGPSAPKLIWHKADLRDATEAAQLVKDVKPTHLFHAAWIATPGAYLTSPENLDWMQAGIAMVRAFAEQGGQRFVGVGTSAEYGPSDTPCAEDTTPIAPTTVYGHSKVAFWHAVQAIADAHKVQAAWGRLFLPYGPGDLPQRLIPATLAALRAGKPMPLSTGEQKRDFVYAPDAATMLAGLLNANAVGAFNIGSGAARSVRSVIESLAGRLNARDLLQFGAMPMRAWEPPLLVADMKKLNVLGLCVRTPMVEALDDFIATSGGEARP
ncbi:MAG TPA: NAD-dependent epimerase/dehydratase family protein [Pseudolabrys sp.]|jgi:nucleoside-diphosphate-sugar epimerase